jgi:[protein-PII] uridylyltransferase
MIVASPHFNLEDLQSEFRRTRDPLGVLQTRTTAVDDLIRRSYQEYLEPVFPAGLALLAVGGYGRSELFPYADIDLLILVEKAIEGDEKRERLSSFLRTLWDSGLRLSQSVRTVGECCAYQPGNLELSISLLDRRLLTGDEPLAAQLDAKFTPFLRSERSTLLRNLVELSRGRHSKFQNTIYHLEPHIKDGPGGLRDLQVVRWLAKIKEEEPDPVAESFAYLANLRCELHFRQRRDHNVLTFALQEELSPQPAIWMREQFRHARTIFRLAEKRLDQTEESLAGGLYQQFRDWRSRISNAEFTVHRDKVLFRSPQQLQQDPALLLRLFEFCARHGVELTPDAEERIGVFLPRFQRWIDTSPPLWPALQTILRQKHAAMALRGMHQSGVLEAIFPEFRLIDCLVIRDFYHRYTVDEHTLVAMEKLLALAGNQDATRANFAEIFTETDNIERILLALIFHDIGKGAPTTDHAAESTRLARRAFDRIQLPEEDREMCLFLIEQHLALSSIMNSRDLRDPLTIEAAAKRTGTVERLRSLTLFTFADSSAVNPEALTTWRSSQLWQLYLSTYAELTRELESARISEAPADLKDFVEGFPLRYANTHSEAEMRAHQTLESKARHAGAAVEIAKNSGSYTAAIVTEDRPVLFASLAGALASFGLNILKAEAFSNTQGMVLDTFTFEDPLRTLELNPPEVERLRTLLVNVASGKEDVGKLLKGRPTRTPKGKLGRIRPIVSIRSERPTSSLIEIVAEDRPGLLFELASAISSESCDIDTVLIHTEAHKAIDVFYVSSGGASLSEAKRQSLRSKLIAVCSR